MKDLQEVATALHKIGAIQFGEFTLTSGRTSPYYVDLRLVYSHPDVFDKLAERCADTIKREVGDKVDRIAGVPVAGLSLATLVSHKLRLPLIFVRKERKEHGRMKAIEGTLEKGDKVVLVDDLVTAGGSVRDAAAAIRDAGGKVEHAVVVLDREEGAREALAEDKIELHACMGISDVVGHLRDAGLLDEEQYSSIISHAKNVQK